MLQCGRVCGPSEIREFEDPEAVEDILRFDVSVDDVLRVQVLEALKNLFPVIGCLLFFEVFLNDRTGTSILSY